LGGRYPLTGTGDVNTHALFAELFATMAQHSGAIIPTGIATEATTAPFFSNILEKKRLAALIDFENRDAIFPGVHRSQKFSILILSSHSATARFSFFLSQPTQKSDSNRRFTLSSAEIGAINPNTRTAPLFRSKADAELTIEIYSRVPVLVDNSDIQAENPWGIKVHTRVWHMTEDAEWFRTARQLEDADFLRQGQDWVQTKTGERYVPLYEAKMIDFFDHRSGSYEMRGDERGYRVLPETS